MVRVAKWLAFTFLLNALFSANVHANTIHAASCSSSDVQTAINSASNGDSVVVPSGSCTWASQVTVSAAVTLEGQTVCSGSGDPRGGTSGVVTCTDSTNI